MWFQIISFNVLPLSSILLLFFYVLHVICAASLRQIVSTLQMTKMNVMSIAYIFIPNVKWKWRQLDNEQHLHTESLNLLRAYSILIPPLQSGDMCVPCSLTLASVALRLSCVYTRNTPNRLQTARAMPNPYWHVLKRQPYT